MIEIHPLTTIPEILEGDDLAAILVASLGQAGIGALRSTDILVVTQKIVSKSEGQLTDLRQVSPSQQALELAEATKKDPRLVELVLRESSAVLRAIPNVLITRHRSGHIMANAGIDRSNTGSADADQVLLLPKDADATAARLRDEIGAATGISPAVIISDSFGRPWRYGVVGVAIGACGLPALIDRRGEADRGGRILEQTEVAFADIVAAASGLVTGEGAEGVPAALIRGATWPPGSVPAASLVRSLREDLFQ